MKIKIGIMLDSIESAPFWINKILSDLLNNEYADLCLVLLNSSNSYPQNSRSFIEKIKKNNFFYNRFLFLDKIYSSSSNKINHDYCLEELLSDITLLEISPKKSNYRDFFNPEDIEKIQSYNLDIIVRFGFRILSGKILKTPKYGIWSFHHGDSDEYRGGPAGFWEVYEESSTTGAVLQILSEKLDGGKCIERTEIRTDFHSPYRNNQQILQSSIPLLDRALIKLNYYINNSLEPKFEDFLEKYTYESNYRKNHIYKVPSNLQTIKLIFKLLKKFLIRKISKRKKEQWNIAIAECKNDLSFNLKNTFWMNVDSKRFFADPFIIKKDNSHYIFFEELEFEKLKGVISVCKFDLATKTFEKIQKVLELPWHLAYPFIFEFDSQIYMIPEQSTCNKVSIYKSKDFPNKWEEEAVLLDGSYVDINLKFINNKWWLWCSKSYSFSDQSSQNNLYLFYSDNLFGPYVSHPCNPVISGLKGSRNAGDLFKVGNDWYRPAQDCILNYGNKVIIKKIKILDIENYKEEEVVEIKPQKYFRYNKGLHTINYLDDNYIIFDSSKDL